MRKWASGFLVASICTALGGCAASLPVAAVEAQETTLPPTSAESETAHKTPREGLVAEYLFEDAATDSSGHGRDGLVEGAVSIPDRHGAPASAYRFDGIDAMIDFGKGRLVSGKARSVSLWVKPENLNGRYFLTSSDLGVWCDVDGTGMAVFSGQEGIALGALASDGDWHHVLSSYDGSTVTTYIDGNRMASEPTEDSDTFADYEFVIGATMLLQTTFADGTFEERREYFAGDIDDVRIYDRAINAAQDIKNLYDE